MGILSRPCVRRRAFELFHWSHELTHLALTVTTLWHATSAWQCVVRARVRASPYSDGELRTVARRYLLGGLVLWLVDHALRFSAGRRHVRVCSLDVEADGAVICLGYECDVPGAAAAGAESEGPLAHAMGQFVFLQVPAIATVEWHPFSISSAPADMAPGDLLTTHHIRCVGDASFTGRLRALARSIDGDGDALASLVVNVDGPYGTPRAESFLALGAVDAGRAHHLLLIAGGIGVTPLHSAFRGLYHVAYRCQRLPAGYPQTVCLVWASRDAALFRIADFVRTLDAIDEDSLGGRFSYTLHCTGHADEEAPSAKARRRTKAPAPAAPRWTAGRPDVGALVRAFAKRTGGAGRVCVCGPRALADACLEPCVEAGVELRRESFEV